MNIEVRFKEESLFHSDLSPQRQNSNLLLEKFNNLQYEDHKWRVQKREKICNFFLKFIVFQNIIIYSVAILYLLAVALGSLLCKQELIQLINKFEGVKMIISVLVTGNLAQTAFMLHTMIKWIFSEIPYEKSSIKKK